MTRIPDYSRIHELVMDNDKKVRSWEHEDHQRAISKRSPFWTGIETKSISLSLFKSSTSCSSGLVMLQMKERWYDCCQPDKGKEMTRSQREQRTAYFLVMCQIYCPRTSSSSVPLAFPVIWGRRYGC